jgi:hypothetical protein
MMSLRCAEDYVLVYFSTSRVARPCVGTVRARWCLGLMFARSRTLTWSSEGSKYGGDPISTFPMQSTQ